MLVHQTVVPVTMSTVTLMVIIEMVRVEKHVKTENFLTFEQLVQQNCCDALNTTTVTRKKARINLT